MANKSTQELLEEARQAGQEARGQSPTPKANEGGNSFKSVFSKYVFDLGETPTEKVVAIPEFPETPVVDFDLAGAGTKPLSDIYAEAGVSSDFSIDDLDAMVNSDEMKSQPQSIKQVSIPFALKAQGITIEVPLNDAASRDAALDAYAQALLDRASSASVVNSQKEHDIDEEMKAFFEEKSAEIEALRQDTVQKETEYQSFLEVKAKEEDRMAKIITPFLQNGQANPVTVGNVPTSSVATATTAVKE